MGTITAQILIGHGHPNDHGILRGYSILQLQEISYWILSNHRKEIRWISHLFSTLEDGFLLIALNFLENNELQKLAEQYFSGNVLKKSLSDCEEKAQKENETIDLNDNISSDHLKILHEKCKTINWGRLKIIICIFQDSSILNQLDIIRNYPMDVEVCTPIYTRLYSWWTEKIHNNGILPEGGEVSFSSEYSVFDELPPEVSQNIERIDPALSNPRNEVCWYEFAINTQSLIQEKANICKKDIKQLMTECGYSPKPSRVAKFKQHQNEWNNLSRNIPKSYLTAIGISIGDIDKTVELDRQLYKKALSELKIIYCKIGENYGHFRETVTIDKAIELLKTYSKYRNVDCLIDCKDLKSIEIKPDTSIAITEYTPEILVSKTDLRFKKNPLIGQPYRL